MRRALTLAGAQTQLVSQWKVADETTTDLMIDYYRRLLRGAQRNLLTSSDRSHPYFWASFLVVGNWAPLPTR